MPRPERSLDADGGLVVQFAAGLRQLRQEAGSPTYRALARRANFSAATLAAAAAGHKLPTLAVTLAYVAACGGDAGEWEARWRAAAGSTNCVDRDSVPVGGPVPYRGLAAFGIGDAAWFFGRDQVVSDLMDRLAGRRFLAVFGPSGVGKSSVLRAGLVPAVQQRGARDESAGPVLVFTPGPDPLSELAVELAALTGVPAGALAEDLSADPARAHLLARQALAGHDFRVELLVVVDQFEEIFTLCDSYQRRKDFVAALLAMCQAVDSRARVVVGVRADYYARCADHPGLVAALADAQVLLGALDGPQVREAVVKPAERAGLMVEGALVSRVVAEVADRPAALPMAAHALLEAWRRRRGTTITLTAYDAAGGVEGAVSQTAEAVWQELDAHQQDTARHALLRLIHIDENGQATRRRVPRAEFNDDALAVLDRFGTARLLSVDHDSVEVTHEALVRAWPRLREWVADDRDGLRIHRQLTAAAATWRSLGQDPGALYRGVRLATAAQWSHTTTVPLNTDERRFLAASAAAQQREAGARRRRHRALLVAAGVVLTVVGILAGLAWVKAGQAAAQRDVAQSRQLAANARLQLSHDPQLALLLAREAYRLHPDPDADAVLRQAVTDSRLAAALPSDNGVSDVAFSPDGTHIAGAEEGRVQIWDYRHNATPIELRYKGAFFDVVTFSPDGRRVAAGGFHYTAGMPGLVVVWDLEGKLPPVVIYDWEKAIRVAFSPDGRLVVCAGDGGTLRVWDSETAANVATLAIDDSHPAAVMITPDGRQVAMVGDHFAVRVWDLASGRLERALRFTQLPGDPSAATLSADGRRLAVVANDQILIRDFPGDGSTTTLSTSSTIEHSVSFSPDGRRIATGAEDGTIRIWLASSPTHPLVLGGSPTQPAAVRFSPDGHYIASANTQREVQLWDATGRADPAIIPVDGTGATVNAISPGGRYTARAATDTIRLVSTSNDEPPAILEGAGPTADGAEIGISADGQRVISVQPNLTDTSSDNTIRLWKRTSGPQPILLACDNPSSTRISADGTRIAALCGPTTQPCVHVWRTDDLTVRTLHDLCIDSTQMELALSPNGRYLAAVDAVRARLFTADLDTGDLSRLPDPEGNPPSLVFAADGKLLAEASEDGTIQIWRTSDWRLTVRHGAPGSVGPLAFAPDDQHLATIGSSDATVRIWSMNNDTEPIVIPPYGPPPSLITFSADGRNLITTHEDHTTRIWPCDICGSTNQALTIAKQHSTRQLTPEERRTYLDNPTS